MENYCTQCGAPTSEKAELCAQCYDAAPHHFYCDYCGEKCYKSKGEYGHVSHNIGEEEDVEMICNECYEMAQDEEYIEDLIGNDDPINEW